MADGGGRPGLACGRIVPSAGRARTRQGCAVAAAGELDAGAEGVTLGAGDGDTTAGAEDDGTGVGVGVVTPGEGLLCRRGAARSLAAGAGAAAREGVARAVAVSHDGAHGLAGDGLDDGHGDRADSEDGERGERHALPRKADPWPGRGLVGFVEDLVVARMGGARPGLTLAFAQELGLVLGTAHQVLVDRRQDGRHGCAQRQADQRAGGAEETEGEGGRQRGADLADDVRRPGPGDEFRPFLLVLSLGC